ncbi:MAG: hypothetical protein M0R30_13320 [Methanoregula sp.]|jgi:hypothetical protein|uniref:hypothetical protein n=1 Tax=Methanoregula sp. TaxID=2052170 RepID=UPI0025EF10A9|nr:hypothetical protein [Methanoregula sp.]MCK9632606.1 hypothetical protein [Methanoregula sp.]
MRLRPFPPILTNIIHAALLVCEGTRFHPGNTCGTCGGSLSGYDERKKRFAILVEEDKTCPVNVIIQRSSCRNCGKIVLPEEPFYPGTRIGSPVVDLCRSLSAVMPYSRVSMQLSRMDVVVDRWSVRHYARMPLPAVASMEVFGMQIPISIVSLSTLAGTVREPGHLDMEDVLMACNRPSMVPLTREQSDRENEEQNF